jgi:hypothetical protein
MENPPLWVWGFIVGIIIAGKFVYRWQATKHLAKEAEERKRKSEDKTNDIGNDFYDNVEKSDNTGTVRAHKYSPRYYYKDYFAIKKKNK